MWTLGGSLKATSFALARGSSGKGLRGMTRVCEVVGEGVESMKP